MEFVEESCELTTLRLTRVIARAIRMFLMKIRRGSWSPDHQIVQPAKDVNQFFENEIPRPKRNNYVSRVREAA